MMGRWGRGAQAGRASARRWARLGRGVLAVELASSECAVAAPASGRSRGRVSGGTWPRGGNTRREAAALSIRLEMVTLGAELVGGVGRASQPEPEVVAVPAGRTGARASSGVGVAASATVTCPSPRFFRRCELDRARLLASRGGASERVGRLALGLSSRNFERPFSFFVWLLVGLLGGGPRCRLRLY